MKETLPEPVRLFIEGAHDKPWYLVVFGILLILTGLNVIVYRSWWAETTSKAHGINKRSCVIAYSIQGALAVAIGLLFVLVPLIIMLGRRA